jgi:transcriptional regulator with XRE-family HTH domain
MLMLAGSTDQSNGQWKGNLSMSDDEIDRAGKKRLNLCGPHLKQIRLQQHLTLVDIQVSLELEYGIALDRTNLGRIENGERSVTDVEVAALARLLGVSLDKLYWGDKSDTDQQDEAIKNVKLRYATRRTSMDKNC